MIPYAKQHISEADIEAVVNVLRSDYITQGPVTTQFEEAICAYTGAPHAVSTNNGTSALHLACRALGLGPGDILWTSPISFVASANCGLYCGAEVDFVDIDPQTWNLSVEALRRKLKNAAESGKLPKIVVPVHFGGLPCDLSAIAELSKQYGFAIIEDASHAMGAHYQGETIGSCTYSDITVFSYHPVKIITTGEGGAAVTRSGELAERLALLRGHGITRDPTRMSKSPDGPWYYQQIDIGYNYRMTELQAALGLSQLTKLDDYVLRRNDLASNYAQLLESLPVSPQFLPTDRRSAFHLYVIRLDTDYVRKPHRQIFEELRHSGVGVNLHYIPIYRQPWYESQGFRPESFPQAERYYQQAITLPLFPDLEDQQVEQIVLALKQVLA